MHTNCVLDLHTFTIVIYQMCIKVMNHSKTVASEYLEMYGVNWFVSVVGDLIGWCIARRY